MWGLAHLSPAKWGVIEARVNLTCGSCNVAAWSKAAITLSGKLQIPCVLCTQQGLYWKGTSAWNPQPTTRHHRRRQRRWSWVVVSLLPATTNASIKPPALDLYFCPEITQQARDGESQGKWKDSGESQLATQYVITCREPKELLDRNSGFYYHLVPDSKLLQRDPACYIWQSQPTNRMA